jgi:outer membrane protein assembly factor BamB
MLRFERVLLAVISSLVTGFALTACATTTKGATAHPSPTTPTVAPASAPAKPALPDPPLGFERDGVALGEPAGGQFAVYADTAYYVRESPEAPALVAADLTAARPKWSKPVYTDLMPAHWTPLHVVVIDGKPRVLLSYLARLKGSGTQADRELLRVLAMDAADGNRLWTVDIDDDKMPTGAATRFSTFIPPQIVAANSDSLVIGTDDSAIVLDARTGNQRWAAAGFRPSALDAGMVVGANVSAAHAVAARNAADGKEAWSNADPFDRVEALGGGLVTVIGTTATRLLEANTGKVRATMGGNHTCLWDADALAVCWSYADHVAGIEVSSGKTLWELSTTMADRIVPRILSVRKGALYGIAGGNGPVIIDARTGRDRVTSANIAPIRVVPGYGLVLSDRGGLFAYKATG